MAKDKSPPADRRIDPTFRAYLVNEKGEEVPITEDMMADSMAKIKLKSIGAHTGYQKAITNQMLSEAVDD